MLPILVFIGLEITAQSFHATDKRHYAALAIACIPAMAKVVMIYVGQYVQAAELGAGDFEYPEYLKSQELYLSVLAGGFIITSLIWASATAKIIDRQYFTASVYFALGGIFVMFGVIHSPLPGDQMFFPWQISDSDIFSSDTTKIVIEFAVAYLIMAALMFILGAVSNAKPIPADDQCTPVDS